MIKKKSSENFGMFSLECLEELYFCGGHLRMSDGETFWR